MFQLGLFGTLTLEYKVDTILSQLLNLHMASRLYSFKVMKRLRTWWYNWYCGHIRCHSIGFLQLITAEMNAIEKKCQGQRKHSRALRDFHTRILNQIYCLSSLNAQNVCYVDSRLDVKYWAQYMCEIVPIMMICKRGYLSPSTSIRNMSNTHYNQLYLICIVNNILTFLLSYVINSSAYWYIYGWQTTFIKCFKFCIILATSTADNLLLPLFIGNRQMQFYPNFDRMWTIRYSQNW